MLVTQVGRKAERLGIRITSAKVTVVLPGLIYLEGLEGYLVLG